ncbi:hypothetical protein AALA54_10370 [Oscillospiraceae bacterium 44-34]
MLRVKPRDKRTEPIFRDTTNKSMNMPRPILMKLRNKEILEVTTILFPIVPNPLSKRLIKIGQMVTIIFSRVYRTSEEKIPIITEGHLINNRPCTADRLGQLLSWDLLSPILTPSRSMRKQRPLEFNQLINVIPVKMY